MDTGVLIPIGTTAGSSPGTPQYAPSCGLNEAVVQKAEAHGSDFALSLVELKGFGGDTESWAHDLDPSPS